MLLALEVSGPGFNLQDLYRKRIVFTAYPKHPTAFRDLLQAVLCERIVSRPDPVLVNKGAREVGCKEGT